MGEMLLHASQKVTNSLRLPESPPLPRIHIVPHQRNAMKSISDVGVNRENIVVKWGSIQGIATAGDKARDVWGFEVRAFGIN
jgi:hypothetical protein